MSVVAFPAGQGSLAQLFYASFVGDIWVQEFWACVEDLLLLRTPWLHCNGKTRLSGLSQPMVLSHAIIRVLVVRFCRLCNLDLMPSFVFKPAAPP
jgi:hypothetical protein